MNKNNKEYLTNQVTHYETLAWYKSYRKLSGIIVFVVSLLTFGIVALVISPVSYFIYKGNKIATILGQLLLLVSVVVNVSLFVELLRDAEGNLTRATSFWYGLIFILTIYGLCVQQLWFAYKVEKERLK